MVTVLRWIWLIALLIALGVGLVAVNNWVFGKRDPLWVGPVMILNMIAGMALLRWCERRGWIKGVFWRVDRLKELEDRKRALATDRERIIAEAAAKAKPR